MDPTDLDYQLSSMAKPLPQVAELEARHIAEATARHRLRKGRSLRSRWAVPVIASAAVALTAGAGTATVAMFHWGGVSMPPENVRNIEPIPVTWMTETGHAETCRVWIELRNPGREDVTQLDSAIQAHDWSGLGQQLYDAADTPPDDPEGEIRVVGSLAPVLQRFTSNTFPGIYWLGIGEPTTERAVDAWGMTCAPEAE
ncbi:hypothetical protein ACIQXM_04685 [Arthrobacter sp. NPDC097144]|uniref:hypothetical protein n=1 Tax=Arthrobacter sp. NPDC097144 TaxID=3363946 RepID=UPI003823CEB5